MAHSLAWSDLSDEHVNDIIGCSTMEEMKEKIEAYAMTEDMFVTNDDKVTEGAIHQWKSIIRDFFYHNVAFAVRLGMDNYKLSVFFSIAKQVHLQSVAEKLTISESFGIMKQLVVDHSVHQPPYRVDIFNMVDVKRISEYLYDTYYRHYKLYQFAFCKKHEADIHTSTIDDFIDKPFEIPDLMIAIPEEVWNERIEAEKRQKEVEEKEEEAAAAAEAAEAQKEEEEQAKKEDEEALHEPVDSKEEDAQQSKEPSLHPILMEQLEGVKQELLQMTDHRVSELQKKVEDLQSLIETMDSSSATTSKKKKPSSAKKKK